MAQSEGVTQLSSFLAECDVGVEAAPETVFRFFVDPDKVRMAGGRRELMTNSRHEGVELAG